MSSESPRSFQQHGDEESNAAPTVVSPGPGPQFRPRFSYSASSSQSDRIQTLMWRGIAVLVLLSVLVLVVFAPQDYAAAREQAEIEAIVQEQHSHHSPGYRPTQQQQQQSQQDQQNQQTQQNVEQPVILKPGKDCQNATLDRGCRFGTAQTEDEHEQYSPVPS